MYLHDISCMFWNFCKICNIKSIVKMNCNTFHIHDGYCVWCMRRNTEWMSLHVWYGTVMTRKKAVTATQTGIKTVRQSTVVMAATQLMKPNVTTPLHQISLFNLIFPTGPATNLALMFMSVFMAKTSKTIATSSFCFTTICSYLSVICYSVTKLSGDLL